MKTTTLFQVRFRPSVKPPRGFTKSAHYNVTDIRNTHFLAFDEYLIGNTWLPAKDFIKIEVQDAPVFQKPVLRKIASLKPDEVIECTNDAELKAVLEQAEREGLVWQYSGRLKPTKYTIKAPNCIGLSDTQNGCIAEILLKDAIAGNYTILPASKFVEVAKAEPEPEWITDPSQVNFKENVGRQFEMIMSDNSAQKGTVVSGKKWQADILGDNKDGAWYFRLKSDGTLNSGALGENFKFRWTSEKPQPELKAFPEGYDIPEGTRVVVIVSNNLYKVKIGEKGTTKETSCAPDVIFDNGQMINKDIGIYIHIAASELAPLDPRDHPEHPEFGKAKQEELITQAQKDECVKLEERIKQLEALCELRQQDSDNFADDLSDCNELINRMKELAKSSLSVNNDMLNKVALRAIANGEI